MLFKLSNLNSNLAQTLGYLNPALNNSALVAQWLVRRTWDQKVESSSPDRCTHVVLLGKTLNSHSASLHPGVKKGTKQIAWGQPDKKLGGNLRWTSITSRGSRNTRNRFIRQKPEISAGTDEPSGSPNYDWGRLYLDLNLPYRPCVW